jgi:very-long-chain (3R)-3-hydroxyacyl-CoA dehydratase
VLARLIVLWLIVDLSPAAQASPALALCFAAWALVEPTRYSFYLVKLLGLEPLHAHKWLRYSLFLVLYPAGILGEFGCLLYAFPGAAALRIALPNQYNFAYSHQLALAALACLYPGGSYMMVGHMLAERRKQLGGSGGGSEEGAKAKAS